MHTSCGKRNTYTAHPLTPPACVAFSHAPITHASLLACSFTDEPLPVDGYVTLSDKPGFGVTLNREGVNLVRPYAQ